MNCLEIEGTGRACLLAEQSQYAYLKSRGISNPKSSRSLAEIRRAGVGPTDIQQAAIGPGIGVFTRHAQVLNTDGTPMLVKDALKLINQVREELASTSDADYDSETRFALDWFAHKGFERGSAGDAINMCNAVNVSLDGIKAAGFFFAERGDARLLKREELPDGLRSRQGHHAHGLGGLPASDQAPHRRDRRDRCGGRALQSAGRSSRARSRAGPPPLRHLRAKAVGGRGAGV